MKTWLRRLELSWTWRFSAHCRVASLGALWFVLLFMGPLGWLFGPLAGLRSVLSLAQTVLNIRLGRLEPLQKQDRADWVLVGAIFVSAYFAAGVGSLTGDMSTWWLYLPLLVPFTVLQARMTQRSYRASQIQEWRTATLIRLEEFRRAQPGELRAA